MFGHYEGDRQTYRREGEVDDIRANSDCLKIFSGRVTEANAASPAELEAIDRDVAGQIEVAVAQARAAPLPAAANLTADVYATY